jgi:hypothetical protein
MNSAATIPLQYQIPPPDVKQFESLRLSALHLGKAELVNDNVQMHDRKSQLTYRTDADEPEVPPTTTEILPNYPPDQQLDHFTVDHIVDHPDLSIISNGTGTPSTQQAAPPAPAQIPDGSGQVYERALSTSDSNYQNVAIPMLLQSTGEHRLLDLLNIQLEKNPDVVVSGRSLNFFTHFNNN